MAPGIGRSIAAGFTVANRSIAGMGLYVGFNILLVLSLGLVAILTVLPTRVPWAAVGRLITQAGETATSPPSDTDQASVEPAPAAEPQAPESPPPAEPAVAPEPPPAPQPPDAATEAPETAPEETTLFDETAKPDEVVAPSEPVVATSAQPVSLSETPSQLTNEDEQLVGEWLGRAWPVSILWILFALVGWTWLYAGQLGYLVQGVRAGRASVSAFWVEGTRCFWPIWWASWLGVLAGLVVFAVIAGVIVGVIALAQAVPVWVLAILGVLLSLGALVGLVWLAVPMTLWPLAIVANHLGPIASLRAAFRATRGRWWRLFGLLVVLTCIALGVWMVVWVLDMIGSVFMVLGPVGIVVGFGFLLLMRLVDWAVNLYLGFATLAASIRFYEDCHGARATTAAVGGT